MTPFISCTVVLALMFSSVMGERNSSISTGIGVFDNELIDIVFDPQEEEVIKWRCLENKPLT
jgi:hypothetical protein